MYEKDDAAPLGLHFNGCGLCTGFNEYGNHKSLGIKKNLERAKYWLQKAADKGVVQAKEVLQELK